MPRYACAIQRCLYNKRLTNVTISDICYWSSLRSFGQDTCDGWNGRWWRWRFGSQRDRIACPVCALLHFIQQPNLTLLIGIKCFKSMPMRYRGLLHNCPPCVYSFFSAALYRSLKMKVMQQYIQTKRRKDFRSLVGLIVRIYYDWKLKCFTTNRDTQHDKDAFRPKSYAAVVPSPFDVHSCHLCSPRCRRLFHESGQHQHGRSHPKSLEGAEKCSTYSDVVEERKSRD